MIDTFKRAMARDFDQILYFSSLEKTLLSTNTESFSQDLYLYDICLQSMNRELILSTRVMFSIANVLDHVNVSILDPQKASEKPEETIALLNIIEMIFEKLEVGTDPHFLSVDIFNRFFERFWDYPSEIYTYSCKFVLNVCKIQDNMSKVVTLLTKSLSFLVNISKDLDPEI
jgi:hypothetical protein